jgi:uncharacterized phage protein gp47/JayE
MSFAAEPYGVFVDDLVTALTGGVTREDFVFLPERAPFRLGFGADHVPGTVRAQGLATGAFTRFEDGVDYTVDGDGVLSWSASGTAPAAGATWPDAGSHFYVSYERVPDPQAPPRLTDRNPGSVLRTLAESFAREYAVLSRQMESVYRAAFLETAAGGDLDHVVALVGIVRRKPTFAAGEVVLARRSPAPADVFVPEGTRISTSEAPPVSVVTSEARVLRAGGLSVSVPVQAEVEGPPGIARAGTLTVVNRPILGIDSASNPSALTLGGRAETDESLRRRAARALETSGRATVDSLVGALTTIEGIRRRDVKVTEDHSGFPGLVRVVVAADLSDQQRAWAAALLEEYRPVGVRIAHNLQVAGGGERATTPDGGIGAGVGPAAAGAADGTRYAIGVTVTAVPARLDLTTRDKAVLVDQIAAAVSAFVDDLAIGDPLIYNRLVSVVMGIDGIRDAIIDAYPLTPDEPGGTVRGGRSNISPVPPDSRLQLAARDDLEIAIWGAVVAFDVRVTIEPHGFWEGADPVSVAHDAQLDISRRLTEHLRTRPASITAASLSRALVPTTTYSLVPDELHFTCELVEEGLRIGKLDQPIAPEADQAAWVRSVAVEVKGAVRPGAGGPR